ncbi:MarR family winged helix-turn-helix transcriptional regulator [Actinokineospora bangkokensis]|uniref:HTH marR-type domain-containing protein n=1 Tax=Actinokineospora bangkokensis TaxID=1193682 RepID=A0A1Q9LKG5_9PSEU|nr:MarR family winged helix-turn-helix transcriptional regulator [Actinokineospora bangkokensis]OLR92541.1 hypothetical protein BJP25_20990 [Actinokineospora bangkokensis]
MIATTTVSDLIEVVRALVRSARSAQHALSDDLPAAPATLLALLDRHGEQRLGRLAATLGVDPSVVSRQVTPLLAAGLVRRRPDPLDGRASLLDLTDEGRACLHRRRLQSAAWFRDALAGWDQADADLLLSLLRRLSADVRGHLVNDEENCLDHAH